MPDSTRPPATLHSAMIAILLTPEAQEVVVRAAYTTGFPMQAALGCGYSPTSFRKTMEQCEDFRAAIEAAQALYVERLESAADRRAVDGWEEEVYQLAQYCGTVRKYSDKLLEVRLRALAPERYRDNVKLDARIAAGVLALPVAAPDAAAWASAFAAPVPVSTSTDPGSDRE